LKLLSNLNLDFILYPKPLINKDFEKEITVAKFTGGIQSFKVTKIAIGDKNPFSARFTYINCEKT